MLIFPPANMLKNAVLNNVATAPKNDAVVVKTEQVPDNAEKRLQPPVMNAGNELKGFLYDLSIKYGQSYEKMYQVIDCESGWDNTQIGDDGRSIGIAQFLRSTFSENCTGDYYSAKDQLTCLASMWQNGLQKRWTCYRMLFE